MIKITPEEALDFASKNYPNCAEKLVKHLRLHLLYSESMTSDGWCTPYINESGEIEKAVIMINSRVALARQRFTLAHELAHLILGIEQHVGEKISLNTKRMSKEEQRVDKFASELLLPKSEMLKLIGKAPFTAKIIERIATKSKVSPLAVAMRLEFLSEELGLNSAMVAFYQNDKYRYNRSSNLVFEDRTAPQELLEKCLEVFPKPYITPFGEDTVLVASLVANSAFNTKTVFIQVISEEAGNAPLPEEKIFELKKKIFNNNTKLLQSFYGTLAAFNDKKAKEFFIDEAVESFFETRIQLTNNENLMEYQSVLLSSEVYELVRLQLDVWGKVKQKRPFSKSTSN